MCEEPKKESGSFLQTAFAVIVCMSIFQVFKYCDKVNKRYDIEKRREIWQKTEQQKTIGNLVVIPKGKDYFVYQPTNAQAKAFRLIRRFEGFRSNAYYDSKQMSIGYGFKAREGQEHITVKEAEDVLKKHIYLIQDFLKGVLSSNDNGLNIWITLDDNQKAGLTSFVYNIGRSGFLNSKIYAVFKTTVEEDYHNFKFKKHILEFRDEYAYKGKSKSKDLLARRQSEFKSFK